MACWPMMGHYSIKSSYTHGWTDIVHSDQLLLNSTLYILVSFYLSKMLEDILSQFFMCVKFLQVQWKD